METERQSLNMAYQINQFYKYLETNKLTPNQISLWHALMNIAENAGYPIWLSVPIVKLETYTGMKKDAIYRARDTLLERNLIEYQPGQGSRAAQYKIVAFDEITSQDIEEITRKAEEQKTKSEEKPTKSNVRPLIPKEKEEKLIENKIRIFGEMQRLVPMPSPIDIQHIKSYLDDGMEDDLLCEAIRIAKTSLADKKPMDQMRYAKGIMRNWFNNGITTMESYIKYEKEREASKNGGNKEYNTNDGEGNTFQEPKENTLPEFRIPGI